MACKVGVAAQWPQYLDWAAQAFRITANGVADETQIHTHICYSECNDIMAAITAMGADVITIETSRAGMELLAAFEHFSHPNQIGLGVYDIHSPDIPAAGQMIALMKKRPNMYRPSDCGPCGLKTRRWAEVMPALTQMVAAARALRARST